MVVHCMGVWGRGFKGLAAFFLCLGCRIAEAVHVYPCVDIEHTCVCSC